MWEGHGTLPLRYSGPYLSALKIRLARLAWRAKNSGQGQSCPVLYIGKQKMDIVEARNRDTDPMPYYPMVVFSSNREVPDLPGLIRGRGMWHGSEEPSYAIPSEEAWRIWPFTVDQEALLYLDHRYTGSDSRNAYLLVRDSNGLYPVGVWKVSHNREGDWSEFGGVRYQITERDRKE